MEKHKTIHENKVLINPPKDIKEKNIEELKEKLKGRSKLILIRRTNQ